MRVKIGSMAIAVTKDANLRNQFIQIDSPIRLHLNIMQIHSKYNTEFRILNILQS